MEQVGCTRFSCEARSGDHPGYQACAADHDVEADWIDECGPDCPDYDQVLDEATARGI